MVRQRSAKPSFAGSIPAVASTRIPLPANFSFEATVVSHGWYLLAPFRWSAREKVLRRAEAFGGEAVDLEIGVDGSDLVVAWRGADVSSAPDGASGRDVRSPLGRMLQLDLDLDEFHRLARQSPAHAWTADERFGRLLCGTTLFEDIVKIVATTNTTWRQTVRMVDLLVAKCGRPSPGGAKAFPTPGDIARFGVEELQRDCRLGYRAKTIHALARGITEGTIDLERVADPSQTTEELFASYRTLPGIGPYGAAHLLAMDGRHDRIAVDTEFRRFVRERYHGGRIVSDRTLLKRYAKWGRWKYLAYWSELWKSVAATLQPSEGSI